jgi:hypothetical protein
MRSASMSFFFSAGVREGNEEHTGSCEQMKKQNAYGSFPIRQND